MSHSFKNTLIAVLTLALIFFVWLNERNAALHRELLEVVERERERPADTAPSRWSPLHARTARPS